MQTKEGGSLGAIGVGQGGEISGGAREDPEVSQIFLCRGAVWCLSVWGRLLLVWVGLVTALHVGDHILGP